MWETKFTDLFVRDFFKISTRGRWRWFFDLIIIVIGIGSFLNRKAIEGIGSGQHRVWKCTAVRSFSALNCWLRWLGNRFIPTVIGAKPFIGYQLSHMSQSLFVATLPQNFLKFIGFLCCISIINVTHQNVIASSEHSNKLTRCAIVYDIHLYLWWREFVTCKRLQVVWIGKWRDKLRIMSATECIGWWWHNDTAPACGITTQNHGVGADRIKITAAM